MSVLLVDLKTQYQRLESDIRARMDAVLEHGQFIMGPEVRELEAALAEFAGVPHVISCASGTDALLMPLMAKGVGPGDAVFTTTFTFIATAEVISLVGATPVLVDIDPLSYNIDPLKLEAAVETVTHEGELRPSAVISVDLFGLPADYPAIDDIANKHDLLVLEDAAQSFGATLNGRRAGSFGHVAATSFFPAKPLGCYGDGGAVLTDDEELAGVVDSIRVHGKGVHKYDNVRVGLNSRLDTLQAAVLLPKLSVFDDELAARQQAADRYTERLDNRVVVPHVPVHATSAWAQYVIQVENRDQVVQALRDAQIGTAIYYPKPLSLQSAYASLGHAVGDFPVAESAAEKVLSLPMHPYLSVDDCDRIVDTVIAAVE